MDPNPRLPVKEGALRDTPGAQVFIAMPFKSSHPIQDKTDSPPIAKARDMTV